MGEASFVFPKKHRAWSQVDPQQRLTAAEACELEVFKASKWTRLSSWKTVKKWGLVSDDEYGGLMMISDNNDGFHHWLMMVNDDGGLMMVCDD